MKGLKITTALCAAAILTGAFTISAGAAVIDPDEPVAVNAEESVGTQLPASYSSVDLGYVTSVKQQQYSDCWVYSTLGTLESKLLRMGVTNVDMNTAHLNLWATTRSNGKGWIRSYKGDAYCTTGPGYLSSWQGGVLESDAEGLTLADGLSGDRVPTNQARWGVTAMRDLTGESRSTIKQEIMDNGGVITGYGHNASLMNNNTAYYMPPSYNGRLTGHLIEVVGWDDNYSKTNFRDTPTQNGAWLIKNSWGTNTPLGGYHWISYEDKWIFNTKYKPAIAIKTVEEITDRKKLVQNEIYGATYEFGYIADEEITFLNRLHFDEDYCLLDKVLFETKCAGADYSLYYVPDANGAPTADETAWIPLGSGVTDYAGYLCVDIADYALPDATGSIAVKLTNSGDKATIGVGEWLTKSGTSEFVFRNESEYGMSYLYRNGTMTDVMQWYKDENDDEIGGTFVIKALTLRPEMGDVNLDGVVNVEDATLIQRYQVELATLTDRQLSLADVTHDGIVDITDATAVQMIAAGYINVG